MTEQPTWILLPGFSQTPSVWGPIAGRLDRTRLAEIPAGCDFATAARRLGEEHGPGIWAGYSMGGRIALRVALEHPALVHHLVLISATAGIRDSDERAERRRRDEELAVAVEQHGVARFLDTWTTLPLFEGVDPAELRAHRMQSAAAIADQLRRLGQGAQTSLWDRLGELAVPTTVVAGARDPAYRAVAVELAAAIPQGRLEIIPEAGHALLIEKPAAVAGVLKRAV